MRLIKLSMEMRGRGGRYEAEDVALVASAPVEWEGQMFMPINARRVKDGKAIYFEIDADDPVSV